MILYLSRFANQFYCTMLPAVLKHGEKAMCSKITNYYYKPITIHPPFQRNIKRDSAGLLIPLMSDYSLNLK